jgi:hypothetical protein
MKIFLMIKTHSKTGLKYLCKTTQDPYKYRGSGVHWKRHLKVHGNEHTTEIIMECSSPKELKEWGLYYSELWNVVESDEWANLRPEEGDGGDTSDTDNYKAYLPLMSENYKKKKWWNNGTTSVFCEQPPDGYVRGRGTFNNAGAKIGADIQKNSHWVNNGMDEQMILKNDSIPEGYTKGRLSSPKKGKPDHTSKGSKWWNNGVISKMAKECPEPGFVLGRLKKY